jgi:hypothetical protein
MTGAYMRVERDGKWENIEVEHMTDAERERTFVPRSSEELVRWINLLCSKVVENEELFNQLVEDGVLEVRGAEEEG